MFVITEDWYFWSHRRSIAAAALKAGWRVTLAARFADHRDRIEAMGVETVDLPIARTGRNPIGELAAVAALARIYRRLQPDVVHHVAIKPVLYGSWAARLGGVPRVVNAISGLGYAFTGADRKARLYGALATTAYRSALRRPGTRTIFQNDDDRAHFVDAGLVQPEHTVLIRGSGVDIEAFRPGPESHAPVTALYAGRMLWSKGVGDLAEAVPLLRQEGHDVRVVLVGHSDAANPEAIPPARLRAWEAEGRVEWWGRRDDMPAVMSEAHLVVLGSEREGVPKVLLEAAGAGKPIVTTDVPGCREVVDDGVNGFLVPVHDAPALAEAVGRLAADPALRARMGAASRAKAVAEFSETQVARETLAIYDDLLATVPA
ncbi:MAG: glycosyltransferase family 4 protein [Bacteroidota bacterium]